LVATVTAVVPDPEGVALNDGWHVGIEQALISIGELELYGDACDSYSESRYQRILNLAETEPQRLALSYGLGKCEISFAVTGPRWNTVLGEGVPPEVEQLFRSPERAGSHDGAAVSFFISGRAEQQGVTKRFRWGLRHRLVFEMCRLVSDAGTQELVKLSTEQETSLSLLVDPLALFGAGFEQFASADTDGDGELSLLEVDPSPHLTELVTLERGACVARIEACKGDDCG
jgi:hypothetical protein